MKIPRVPYKKAVKILDAACRSVVMARDMELYDGICPLCGVNPINTWYHFLPRTNTPIRWHLANSCGSCSSCNCAEFKNRGKILFEDKIKAKHAEMFGSGIWQQLKDLSRQLFKKSAEELLEMAAELTKLLEGK